MYVAVTAAIADSVPFGMERPGSAWDPVEGVVYGVGVAV